MKLPDYLFRDTLEIAKTLDIVQKEGPQFGLVLNIKKTEQFCSVVDPRSHQPELFFFYDISRPLLVVKLLVGAVSVDEGFMRALASKSVAKSVELMETISQSKDLQCELVLLRACMGISKLYSARHILQSGLGRVSNYISRIRFYMNLHEVRCPQKAMHILADGCFNGVSNGLHEKFDLGLKDFVVLGCLRAPHAQDFLLATHIKGLGQCMSPTEYRVILKYRLLIPLYQEGDICPACHKVRFDSFGEHVAHYRNFSSFKYRHDLVRDVLYDIIWKAGISVRKKIPVNFLLDPAEGRSTLSRADVLVYSWNGGKHTCVDLTGVSPLHVYLPLVLLQLRQGR